jgi:hypothetical protein
VQFQSFLQEIAFSKKMSDSEKPKTLYGLKDIDEEYNNWFISDATKGPLTVWQKQKKTWFQLRGIWHEVFFSVLRKMDNEIEEEDQRLTRFGSALDLMRRTYGSRQKPDTLGLLDVNVFQDWLRKEVVEGTEGCSQGVFKKVLKMANVNMEEVIADALWMASDIWVEHRQDGIDIKHESLRNVADLEDRVVMYFSKGLGFESVRSLIFDELQVPLLQQMGELEIRTAFDAVDDKTGQCGCLEPHEIMQMVRLLTKNGMHLNMMTDMFKKLKMNLSEDYIRDSFLAMDTNADDLIDVPEFLGMIDLIITTLVPQMIFERLEMQPQHIIRRLLLLLCGSVIMLTFIVISIGAFQVEVSKGSAGMASSLMRAGIAIVAVLGLRRDAGDEDQDKMFKARGYVYEIMGVSASQMEARKRTPAMGDPYSGRAELAMRKREINRSLGRARGGAAHQGHHDDHHDDDHDGD